MTTAKKKTAVCSCCGKKADSREDFCYGCQHIVCLRCVRRYGHEGHGMHLVPSNKRKRATP
jgi:hypothetical protein